MTNSADPDHIALPEYLGLFEFMFNDMSILVKHFVLSPRGRKKSHRRHSRGKEREN